jgi:enoyl-CoA hydratase/carnithine racemase
MAQFFTPKSFRYEEAKGVGSITLSRPKTVNSLTFEVYRELTDFFYALRFRDEVRAIVITGEGKGFCSGGDVEDIIKELFSRDMKGLLEFTRMTGELIINMRAVKRPVIAAINGTAAGAGAVIALAADLRIVAEEAKFYFLFPKVGLAGADMGAAYLLPRVVGLGRATELLYFGDAVPAKEAERIGLANRVVLLAELVPTAQAWAQRLAKGPAFATGMTKELLDKEASLTVEQAIEAEAQAQAICMQHPDFKEAYEANKNKRPPKFFGAPQD